MLRRVTEDVVVAVVVSAVTWALSNPDDSASRTSQLVDAAVSQTASVGAPLLGWLWLVSGILLVGGVTLQVFSMAPVRSGGSWEIGVSLPSLPTTLMGAGLVSIALAFGVRIAIAGSVWSLPVGAMALYLVCRWFIRLKDRWTISASAL